MSIRIRAYPLCTIMGFFLCLTGCTPGQQPFKQVQFCFTKINGPAKLRYELKQISEDEKMVFHDVSDQSFDQVKSSAPQTLHGMNKSDYIVIFLGTDDGMGLGAGNQGLGGEQVAVGFTSGKTPGLAKMFAKRVLARLATKWDIHEIGNGSAALPLNCSEGK